VKFIYSLTASILIAVNASSVAADQLTPASLSTNKQPTPIIELSTQGTSILRAQVLLDRAHFSPGEIDAIYGANLRKAINGFQQGKGLQVTGIINEETWSELNNDPYPILTPYFILDTDVAGPFNPVPTKIADKAKMTALNYTSVAEALGEKFHIAPKLLIALNPTKDLTLIGEEIVVPNIAISSEINEAAKVIISKSKSTVTVIDTSGNTIAQFPASIGSPHDPLPLGSWKIRGIIHNPVYRYNPKLFWDADPSNPKAIIAAGPNNPVGVVWIDLSKEHYGIHGTPDPSRIGKSQSHGCIRLTNWDALTLAQSVFNGVEVLMQK
jgi:lipoprotein-anchoring transpeptidase ErfK/SrfK